MRFAYNIFKLYRRGGNSIKTSLRAAIKSWGTV